jgi:hypothetical protein
VLRLGEFMPNADDGAMRFDTGGALLAPIGVQTTVCNCFFSPAGDKWLTDLRKREARGEPLPAPVIKSAD